MRKINQKNLNQFFEARHTALLQNLARDQKSLATPGIEHTTLCFYAILEFHPMFFENIGFTVIL